MELLTSFETEPSYSSRHAGDGVFGSVNRVFVDDVDERDVTFHTRELNRSTS